MKKVFAASALATFLIASTAFAMDMGKSTQPIKGTEGPDIQFRVEPQPAKGTEGPDVQYKLDSQPVKGLEGPDVQ